MADQFLQSDIETAEAIDEHLQEQSIRIEDIHGSLEAITQAIVGDGEPEALTEHQQAMVDVFRSAAKDHKGAVYAVADAEALEGFFDATASLARKAALAFGQQIPAQFKSTAKGLTHYVEMAQKLRTRLQQLRPLLEKREYPYVDVFDYGAYSRFFQVEGQSIAIFSHFQETMQVQNAATYHVMQAASSYAVVVMEKLLEALQGLQAAKQPDAELLVTLRDSIALHWEQTWKEAGITTRPGQTPQVVLNEFPDRKFVSLAPLFDNRYLVAHQPKSVGGDDPNKITLAIRHYGASLVFDKKADKATQDSMNVPNMDEMLKMVDQTITVLGDMRAFEDLAKKNDVFAKDFKKAAEVLNKMLASASGPEFYGFVAEYFKLATAVSQAIQQPYVPMAWMYVRCAMVVVALAELAAVEDPNKRLLGNRFFAKQGTEFGNPAMESYQLTKKALEAAKRVKSA